MVKNKKRMDSGKYGTVRYVSWYTPELVRDNPDILFVFGDNMMRVGRGGQAAACRDQPNAVGIPTKHAPGMNDSDFFSDHDLREDAVLQAIDGGFKKLLSHLYSGKDVVWPADGIGTGLAQLPQRAPAIYKYIQRKLDDLTALYGSTRGMN